MEKIVVFDLDGTIIDTEQIYKKIFFEFLAKDNFSISDEEYEPFPGSDIRKLHKFIADKYEGFYPKFDDFSQAYKSYKLNSNINYKENIAENAVECIEQLHQMGYKLAIASSSQLYHIEEVLNQLELHDFFEIKVSGHDFEESKPNPEIYEYTCSLLGAAPEDCWAIEDSVPGIAAAKAAGMMVIARKDEHFGLDQSAADFLIEDMLDIIGIIENEMEEDLEY
ncbi:MAG: HAD family hydrolase [Erysipelotrichaceae bacterium]